MTCSPARLAANRANALKSTGPKTEGGKAASRCNALKHGLTGEGVALSGEDAAEVARRFEAIRGELHPRGELADYLARRVATLTLRVERCVLQESAALSTRVARAEAAWDEARLAEADHLFSFLAGEPSTYLRQLRRMPEGVDRLILGWEGLKAEAVAGRWSFREGQKVDELAGKRPEEAPASRSRALSEAIFGKPDLLDPAERDGRDPQGLPAWATAQLVVLIEARIAELVAHRATLDHEGLALERAGAPARALFDPSREATLARRYEAAAERALEAALRRLQESEAEGPAEEPAPPPPRPLASFGPAIPAVPPRPRPDLDRVRRREKSKR